MTKENTVLTHMEGIMSRIHQDAERTQLYLTCMSSMFLSRWEFLSSQHSVPLGQGADS